MVPAATMAPVQARELVLVLVELAQVREPVLAQALEPEAAAELPGLAPGAAVLVEVVAREPQAAVVAVEPGVSEALELGAQVLPREPDGTRHADFFLALPSSRCWQSDSDHPCRRPEAERHPRRLGSECSSHDRRVAVTDRGSRRHNRWYLYGLRCGPSAPAV